MERGPHTYGTPQILKWKNAGNLIIGDYCSIANEVVIFLDGEHRKDWITTYPFPAFSDKWPEAAGIENCEISKGDVVIGNDVWICHGATILSGVKIGDGAIIGARAVVTRDVSPYSIVAGNPAREIKKRFSDEDIEKLLQIKWWEWSEEKIKQNIEILCSGNIEALK
jgi:acetyltransferase-like isoleucine patch superfamily enzyme